MSECTDPSLAVDLVLHTNSDSLLEIPEILTT